MTRPCARAWLAFGVGAVVLVVGTAPAGRLPAGDAPHLLAIAHRLANLLTGGETGAAVALLGGLITPHPPAGYLVPALGYALGLGAAVPLVTGLVALALIWHGMLLLVRVPGEAARIPVVGGLAVLGSGMTWAMVDWVAWDLLAAGLVIACIGHMWASCGLSGPRHAVAVGVLAGLGCLTKYTFPVFLVLPSLAVGVAAIRKRQWVGVALALSAFAVLAGPWLFEHLDAVLAHVSSSSDPGRTISDSPAMAWGDRMTWASLLYYPSVLRDAWGWPVMLLLLLALPGLWHPGCRLALLGAAGGGAVLTFAGEQQARYLFPALPLLAVLIDVGLAPGMGSRQSRRKLMLFSVAVLPALWGAFATSWVHTEAPSTRSLEPESLWSWGTWPWPVETFQPTTMAVDSYSVDEVVVRIAGLTGPGAATVGIVLPRGPAAPPASAYMWRAEQQGHSWTWATVARAGPAGRPHVFLTPNPTTVDSRARRFSVAYIVRFPGQRPGPVEDLGDPPSFTHSLPGGRTGILVRIQDEAWDSPAGQRLSHDPMGP